MNDAEFDDIDCRELLKEAGEHRIGIGGGLLGEEMILLVIVGGAIPGVNAAGLPLDLEPMGGAGQGEAIATPIAEVLKGKGTLDLVVLA
jgi:hypothetical protein